MLMSVDHSSLLYLALLAHRPYASHGQVTPFSSNTVQSTQIRVYCFSVFFSWEGEEGTKTCNDSSKLIQEIVTTFE